MSEPTITCGEGVPPIVTLTTPPSFTKPVPVSMITVPGQFFDVNPGKRRGSQSSRFNDYARFSFGPPEAVIESACDRLESLISDAKSKG